VSAFGNFIEFVVGAVLVWTGWAGKLGFILMADAYGREQQEEAKDRAERARAASLRDRYQMVRSGTAIRSAVYGRARVSGPIAYAQSTGTKKEFLHLVVCLAGQESDAIETVLFNDIALPAENGSTGMVESGEFAYNVDTGKTETFMSSPMTTSLSPLSVQSVTRTTIWVRQRTPYDQPTAFTTEVLTQGVGYTQAGSVFTIIDGLGVKDGININYTSRAATPRVRIKKFLGALTQSASSDLVTDSGGKWTSNHKLGGITYVYARLEFEQNVFGQIGVPNISAIIRGRKVYDPRKDNSRGGTAGHRVATPSTWEWSENSALCTGDFLRDSTYGMGATDAQVPYLEQVTAANICDELVTIYSAGTVSVTNGIKAVVGNLTSWITRSRFGMNFIGPNAAVMTIESITDNTNLTLSANYAGSTLSGQAYSNKEKRYTCNGVIDSDKSARENLNSLLQSMAGSAAWIQGRWFVLAGAHTASVLTITEDHLTGDPVEVISTAARRDLFNRIIPTYAEKEKLYTSTQAPYVTNATYVAKDGGLDLPLEVTYNMVTGGVTAQRLAKIFLERSRQALTVSLFCNMTAYNVSPGDVIAITISRYGWSGKLFQVLKRTVDFEKWSIGIVARETASAVWDWAEGQETAIDLTPNTTLPNPFAVPSALANLTADSTYTNALYGGSGSITPRAKIAWTQSTDIFVVSGGSVEVQFKSDEASFWNQVTTVPGGESTAYISPIQGNRLILIRIRPVNSRGRAGPWTTITHNTSVQLVAGNIGGSNLAPNSSFEQDTNVDGIADSWYMYSGGPSLGVVTNTLPNEGVGGSRGQRLDCASLGANGANVFGMRTISPIAIIGLGRSFTYSVVFAASATTYLYLQIDWYNGASPIQADVVTVINDTALPLERVSGIFVAPPNATHCYLVLLSGWRSNRAVGGSALVIDNVQFEAGETLTAYSPRADELLSTQFSGVSLGGGNVVANSSFEKWTGIGDGPPQVQGIAVGWVAYNAGTTGTITRTIFTAGGLNNGKYQRASATNLGTTSADNVGVQQTSIRCDGWAGLPFVLSALVRGDVTGLPQARLQIDWYNSTPTYLSSSTLSTSITTGFIRYALNGVVPATAVRADVFLFMQSRPSAAGASAIEFDAVQLELGSVMTAYRPKSGEELVRLATTGQALNFDPDCTSEDEWEGVHPCIAAGIATGITGSTALHSTDLGTDNHVYSPFARSVPVDRLKAYRVSALVRKGGGANAGAMYLGIMGWSAAGVGQRGVGSPAVPYTAYSVAVTDLTTAFVRHTVTISQATITAMQADVVFIGPHCILGYTGASTLNGWVEMQDVRLEEVGATRTIDLNAVTLVASVTAASTSSVTQTSTYGFTTGLTIYALCAVTVDEDNTRVLVTCTGGLSATGNGTNYIYWIPHVLHGCSAGDATKYDQRRIQEPAPANGATITKTVTLAFTVTLDIGTHFFGMFPDKNINSLSCAVVADWTTRVELVKR